MKSAFFVKNLALTAITKEKNQKNQRNQKLLILALRLRRISYDKDLRIHCPLLFETSFLS